MKKINDLPLEDQPDELDNHGPLFVLGCPRSGTTFLSETIGVMDEVEEWTGNLSPPRILHWIARNSDASSQREVMSCIKDIYWQSFWRRRYFREESFLQCLRGRKSWKVFFRRPTLNGIYFCYKDPFLAFPVETFHSFFPNAKFIHILRDGRDAADSMVRTYPDALSDSILRNPTLARNKVSEIGFFDANPEEFLIPWWIPQEFRESFPSMKLYERYILLWRVMVERARKLKEDKRYHEVRYEALVKKPLAEMERITQFLNLDLSPRLRRRVKKAFVKSVGIGTKNRSHQEMAGATRIAGPLLRELGYIEESDG